MKRPFFDIDDGHRSSLRIAGEHTAATDYLAWTKSGEVVARNRLLQEE